MHYRLTKVELFDHKFPGLREFIDLSLDDGASAPRIAEAARKKFPGLQLNEIPVKAYRTKRWKKHKEAVRQRRVEMEAEAGLIGERGLDYVTQSRLWDAINGMNSTQLLALRRVETQRIKLQFENQRIENEKKELQLKIEKFQRDRQAVEEATHEAQKKIRAGKQLTAKDLGRIRERVFGSAVNSQ